MTLYKDVRGNPTYPSTTPNPSDVKGAIKKNKRSLTIAPKPISSYALNTPSNSGSKNAGLELKAMRSLRNFSSRREVKEASEVIAKKIDLESAVLGITGLGQIEYNQRNPRWQNPLDLSAGKFLTLLTIYDLSTQKFSELTGITLPGRFDSSYTPEDLPEPPAAKLFDLPHYYANRSTPLPTEMSILDKRTVTACSYLSRSDFAVAGDVDLNITSSTNLLVDTTFKDSPYKIVKVSGQLVLTTTPPEKSRVLAGAFHMTVSKSLI